MKKHFLLIFCFLTAVAFSLELRLKDKLTEATPGSYIVTEQNKNYTFLYIREYSNYYLVIEEVTIPSARYQRHPLSWRTWFENGAPGHTSWTLSQINLETGQFEKIFSFNRQKWVDLSHCNSFLITLINLRFQLIPEEERRRIGPPPAYRKADYRAIWVPPLVVDGQHLTQVPFSAWRTRWPADTTELSRKYVEIYIPYPTTSNYPTYFPYWVEIEGKIGSIRLRIIDSGTDACSPNPDFSIN